LSDNILDFSNLNEAAENLVILGNVFWGDSFIGAHGLEPHLVYAFDIDKS